MKIYTKTGDNGTTSLVGGKRVPKTDQRLEVYGTIDELVAYLGLLRSKIPDDEGAIIIDIQNTLMCIGTYIATDTSTTELPECAQISDEKSIFLEQNIDKINDFLPKISNFIIPGDDENAAVCHICRTITRRVEREILSLENQMIICNEIKKYINRLSDFLFVFARFLALKNGTNDFFWKS